MGSVRLDRWMGALALIVAGMVVGVTTILDGSIAMGTVLLVILAVVGWWSWPGRKGPHISHREAQDQADADDVIVYWRPG